jgi:hypothetical protein
MNGFSPGLAVQRKSDTEIERCFNSGVLII